MVFNLIVDDLTVELPYPPSINHYYYNRRGGGKFIGAKGVDFRAKVQDLRYKLGMKRVKGKVDVSVYLYPADNRRRDIDNILKCLLDALVISEFIDDDSLIFRLFLEKKEVVKGGKILVNIKKYKAD